MSDIVDAIEASFKELVKSRVYRSITVKDICADAHVSRNTFYTNFRDKRAILAHLFDRDCIAPIERVNELLTPEQAVKVAPSIVAKLYEGVQADQEFYSNLVPPMCGNDATFEMVVARASYNLILKSVGEDTFDGTEVERRASAYYYASAQALFLEKWIADRFRLPIETISELQASMLIGYWAKKAGVPVPGEGFAVGTSRPGQRGLLR